MNDTPDRRADENKNIATMIKGLMIGGTMLVPGVSGGSMAMILGIYDSLIRSVSSFMKHKKENFKFLLLFAAGGSLGMFLFSRPMLYLIQTHTMPTLYFFLGTIIGGVPLIFRKSQLDSFSLRGFCYIACGIAIVLAISLIPTEHSQISMNLGMESCIFLVLAGFIAAIALVLPGISVSYLFLIMGLYDEIMKAINQVYLPFLLPLAAGLFLGVVLTTKLLEKAMTMFPQPTYLMILGFLLGSVIEVFPGIPTGLELFICILTWSAGFGGILLLSYKENKDFKDNT